MTNVEAVALALIRDSVKALDQKCNEMRAERDAARADLAAAVAEAERERDASVARADAAERVVEAALQAAAPAFAHRKRAETDGAAAITYEAMAYRALDAILAALDAARGKT